MGSTSGRGPVDVTGGQAAGPGRSAGSQDMTHPGRVRGGDEMDVDLNLSV